jgi:phage protein U
MFAQLGEVEFQGLESPSQWDSEMEWNWADLDRIGVKPASQAIGKGLTTHTLALRIDASFADVPASLARLIEIGDEMEPVPYLLGNGEFVNLVTFRKMSVMRRNFAKDGTLETAEITIELSEYIRTRPAKGSAVWD